MDTESCCMIVETCIYFDFIISYEGEWKKGKAYGTGTYTTSNVTYEGEWLADKQHGLGKETWRGGDVYEGDFMFGMKQGKGKFSWADGSRYEIEDLCTATRGSLWRI